MSTGGGRTVTMRIGLDARSVSGKTCGVSRYALSVISALSEADTENEYIVYTDQLKAIEGLGSNFLVRRTDCPRMNAFYDLRFYGHLKRDQLDVYHALHSWLPEMIPSRTKAVVTIHDLFAVTDPQFFAERKPLDGLLRRYFRYVVGRSLKRSAAVVAVSSYCRRQLSENFSVDEGLVSVIPEAPGIVANDFRESSGPAPVEGQYLLYLGNFRSYKNVPTLVRGYAEFCGKRPAGKAPRLVIAGNDAGDKIQQLVDEVGISDNVEFMYRPTDSQIAALYKYATAFIFPSRAEGFGIPPLEAQSFGVPTIVSNADALVEVSGSAAVVFDKDNPSELAEAIARVVDNGDLRESLRQEGFRNAKQYSWSRCAERLKQLYGSL